MFFLYSTELNSAKPELKVTPTKLYNPNSFMLIDNVGLLYIFCCTFLIVVKLLSFFKIQVEVQILNQNTTAPSCGIQRKWRSNCDMRTQDW